MASMLRFITDPIDLQEEIKRRDDFAESIRREHFIAARKIQAWIRGILTRNHLRLLHASATTIQRHWRGYRVRIATDRYLVERVHQMWQDYYDQMATRIQANWRGYWARKTVLDMPKRRLWLKNVYAKNVETVNNMKKFKQNEIEYAERAVERESMHWILFILFKLHHLLGTKHRPGVITRIDRSRCTFIEEMLKCFEYRHYKRKATTCRDCQIDPKASLVFRGTYYEKCEREIREMEKNLQAGVVPVFRSQPYEEQEKVLRKLNHAYREASLHNSYETPSPNNLVTLNKSKKTCPKKSPKKGPSCVKVNELYGEIKKMDCHLNQLHLKCPVHDISLST